MMTAKFQANLRRRHFIRLSVLSAISATAISWPREAKADLSAGYAFDTGLHLGYASYQASERQTQLTRNAIRNAQAALDNLVEIMPAIFVPRGKPNIWSLTRGDHDKLARERQSYETSIRRVNNTMANVYRLGLLIGLAEAQCTSSRWGSAQEFAHSALVQIEELIGINGDGVSGLDFNRQLLEDAMYQTSRSTSNRNNAYQRVKTLRESYRNVVIVSNF